MGAEVGPVASAFSTEGEPRQVADAGRNDDEGRLFAVSSTGVNTHTPFVSSVKATSAARTARPLSGVCDPEDSAAFSGGRIVAIGVQL
jgi:hypothetical protein